MLLDHCRQLISGTLWNLVWLMILVLILVLVEIMFVNQDTVQLFLLLTIGPGNKSLVRKRPVGKRLRKHKINGQMPGEQKASGQKA